MKLEFSVVNRKKKDPNTNPTISPTHGYFHKIDPRRSGDIERFWVTLREENPIKFGLLL